MVALEEYFFCFLVIENHYIGLSVDFAVAEALLYYFIAPLLDVGPVILILLLIFESLHQIDKIVLRI